MNLFKKLGLAKISGYFKDSRDGQKYRTVKIGGKTWMAQNLNYQTENSWCYGGDNSNGKKYGRLYDWNTAKAACPSGWHLPSREEWGDLAKAVGGTGDYGDDGVAGKKLKSTSGWNNGGNGTDEYGFSGLPGGLRDSHGFYLAGGNGYWWTATEIGNGNVYSRAMDSDLDIMGENHSDKNDAFSVRCVRDD